MTGYGRGQAALAQGRLILEVRSLNHRFVDVRVRLPSELAEHAFLLEQATRERVGRGRYDVSVRVEAHAGAPVAVDVPSARAAFQSLCALRDQVAPGADVPLSLLTAFPELFRTATSLASPEETTRALTTALTQALQNLNRMRQTEGETLVRDFTDKLDDALRVCNDIAAQSTDAVTRARDRLRTRIERLLTGTQTSLDSGRLEQELALLADRSDIDEELVRLGVHLAQFKQLLGESGPLGRKLDFLLQEISRETNTIGAKSQDTGIAHLVVELKAIAERLREQVQNVE